MKKILSGAMLLFLFSSVGFCRELPPKNISELKGVVSAKIVPSTDEIDRFILYIRNISSKTIRFLDIKEGDGRCGEFYEVVLYKGRKQHYKSKGECLYAPILGEPEIIELQPGQIYTRIIKPGAYISSEEMRRPPYTLEVTYRLSDKIKSNWANKSKGIDLGLIFKTQKLTVYSQSK
ncbi:MAG: hypothetical protein C4540_02770 [Candidatus Omnitrophota bacterium]|jgi:hypothetical protein|nr:MAG: hypothetical protein C4540_02770 [Candidatus Omnitrophota bacterium]